MTTATHRGIGRTVAVLFAAASFLATSSNLSALTLHEVAANTEFRFVSPNDAVNSESYELLVNAGESTKVYLPRSGKCNCFLYMKGSGTVTLKTPDDYQGGDQVTFVCGIAADSTVTVNVDGVSAIKVGRENSANNINYPVVDVATMTFEGQDVGKLVLTNKCTARALPSSFEVASGATVALQGTNPLRLGATLALADYDVVVMTRASIPDGCAISVSPGRTLALKPANTAKRDGSTYKWNWSGTGSYFDESFSIFLGGKGARVLCRNTSNPLRLFTPVTGVGEVVFKPDNANGTQTLVFRGKTYSSSRSVAPVSIPINTEAEPAVPDTWQNKVSHWFDASDSATVVPFSFDPNAAFGWTGVENKFNGNQIVIGWKDKVEGSNLSFYNSRIWNNYSNYANMKGDYNLQVMPYLVADGLNGKPYLSFGGYNTANLANAKYNSSGALASATEARRLLAWNGATPGDSKPTASTTTFGAKYCIMVFGSQQGGGRTILGDDVAAGSGNLGRAGNTPTLANPWTLNNSGCSWMIDGVSTNSTSAKPSGGWQILSIDMTATNIYVKGLGLHNTDSTYGGQNYAEIIFFSEAPTDAERRACESYLAEKWSLKSTYSFRAGTETFSELSGGEGTTVTIGDYSTDDLTGSSKTYVTPSEVTIAGNYKGTINVASGKTLVVSDRPAPPDAYDMPQQNNIVAWFDPSLAGAIDFVETNVAPNGVARLYSRTASGVDKTDGAYWMSMQAQVRGTIPGLANYYGRYPTIVSNAYAGAAGTAPTMPWMDFTVNVLDDKNGNTLRSHKLPDLNVEQTGATFTTFRSLFMALDSSIGGGNPVGDAIAFDKKIKPRDGYGEDYTQPIWVSGTTAMAHTWLDTNEVNGTTQGYSGRGEVLGFETAADLTANSGLFLGYYNPNHGNTNYEHIAETVVYSTTLADNERQTVQKYLMAKWFGDLNNEFCDLSGATVTGAGNVKSASLRNLPAFGSGFTGNVSGGSLMTFRVNAQGVASVVVDPIAVDHAVALDSECSVTITVIGSGKLAAGTYTLLSATSLTGGDTIVANVVNGTGRKLPNLSVCKEGNAINLVVTASGTIIMFK